MIPRRSLADEVAESLQQAIAAGRYAINEQLPIEPELMKTYGVGRSTIREAIRILANSGYLRVQQGVGTFVEDQSGMKEPLPQRLKRAPKEDLDEVRQLLEMKIAEKAALNRTQKDIKKMTALLEKRNKKAAEGSLQECLEADIQFHIAIAEAARNEILTDLYKSFAIHIHKTFTDTFTDTKVFLDSAALHEQLLQSIAAGDATKAWNDVTKIIGHR